MSLVQNIAILGAGTLIGQELLSILEQRDFPVRNIYLYDAAAGQGQKTLFKGKPVEIMADYKGFLNNVTLVFCCLDKVRARAVVAQFRKNSLVLDLSGAFRFAPHVLHIIPEINGDTLSEHTGVVANPNPITIQLLVALSPLHEKFKLRRMHITALCAVSDLGQDALDELNYEYEFLAVGEPVKKAQDSVFPYTIGNNLIPQIGDFVHHGYTEEETLLLKEITGILGDDDIQISATYVWVPLRQVNSAVVYADFKEEITVASAKKILKNVSGVKIMTHDDEYPTPENVVGSDDVFIGRLRQDSVFRNGLSLWIAADNLRKGSALNAVQIAELL